jgi:hypothetical protein
MNQEEKNNILDQHKQVYDGYVTKYNQESNQTPLYIQDFANDKEGITVNNKGEIKTYTNVGINESMLDTIGDGPTDLENGTVDLDSNSNPNHDDLHDVYPSPNEEEDEYVSLGNYKTDMTQNLDQYEYDIDQLEDYSTEEISENEDDVEDEEISVLNSVDDEDIPDLMSSINESLDMFRRFKNYN